MKSGFTLVEVMIVISIIGVLVGTLTSVINPNAQKERALDAVRRTNVEKIVMALDSYYALEGTYPKDEAPKDDRPDNITNYIQDWPDGAKEGGTYTYSSDGTSYGIAVVTATDNTYKYRTEWGLSKECVGEVAADNTDCIETGVTIVCGDGVCKGTETCTNCQSDCGNCAPTCGDKSCNGSETCHSCEEDCGTCVINPTVCPDGKCESPETCSTCPKDCGLCKALCGDGKCESPETITSCPKDCAVITPTCGDGICVSPETAISCPKDCLNFNPPTGCGDGNCVPPETPDSCPKDCYWQTI